MYSVCFVSVTDYGLHTHPATKSVELYYGNSTGIAQYSLCVKYVDERPSKRPTVTDIYAVRRYGHEVSCNCVGSLWI